MQDFSEKVAMPILRNHGITLEIIITCILYVELDQPCKCVNLFCFNNLLGLISSLAYIIFDVFVAGFC